MILDTVKRFTEATIDKTKKYNPAFPNHKPNDRANENITADQNNNDEHITQLLDQYMPIG